MSKRGFSTAATGVGSFPLSSTLGSLGCESSTFATDVSPFPLALGVGCFTVGVLITMTGVLSVSVASSSPMKARLPNTTITAKTSRPPKPAIIHGRYVCKTVW
ncbi:MAG: hypothetical protein N2C14_22825, partial [Planctomycetales bacterium]